MYVSHISSVTGTTEHCSGQQRTPNADDLSSATNDGHLAANSWAVDLVLTAAALPYSRLVCDPPQQLVILFLKLLCLHLVSSSALLLLLL